MVSEHGTAGSWPAVTHETLPWQVDDEAAASRTTLRKHRGNYDAAVLAKIADAEVRLPSSVLAELEDAAAEVARFDSELGREIAPFGAVLLRSESAASSRIENLTASARAVAEAELGDSARSNAAMIVSNGRSMQAAIDLADHIDSDAILTLHRTLLERDEPAIAGKWRDQQVWIGGSHIGPHLATFVPPQHSRIPAAIEDLIAFIDRDDIAVLAHAAIAHAQFETIHPFPDGNGRTGRTLVHAQLRNKGVTRNVTVPISAGLLTDTERYFSALTQYREGDPSPIAQAFADAAFAATTNGRLLAADIDAARERWRDEVKARAGATAWKIVDLLVQCPVINAALIAERTGIAAQNAYRALEPLVAADVVVEVTSRRRNRMWRSPEILDALDQFAARAGRRTAPRR